MAPGRPLLSDREAEARGFDGPEAARRREILRETIAAFDAATPRDAYHRLAASNLELWSSQAPHPDPRLRVEVCAGDWGDVTHDVTRRYGARFAVLNMANAFVPGGAYVEGAVAQEENMFRRTDCHFRIDPAAYDDRRDRYLPEATRLLSALDGRVYLDTENPRVCIRGREDRARRDLGYAWLDRAEVFSFFELRAAAKDLRDGSPFDARDARRRIAAQLDTLRAAGIRHAVLGAFGCGAFSNPASSVAAIYRDEIAQRRSDFAVITFAVFDAGYGPNNFAPFAEAFREPL